MADKIIQKAQTHNQGYALDDAGVSRQIIHRQQALAQNLPRYFTGKHCKNGHLSERYHGGVCVACQKANSWIEKGDRFFGPWRTISKET